MVNRGKVFSDVALQRVGVLFEIVLVAHDCLVRPLADSVGVGIEDKAPLQNGPDNGDKRMMHHPVTEWRCTDLAWF